MARHRRDDEEADPTQLLPKTILPETVEELAAAERAEEALGPWPALRRPMVIPAVAVAVFLALGGGAWVLSGGSAPLRLFPPPDTAPQSTGQTPIEGFGEAPAGSPFASTSASSRTSARPSASPSAGVAGGGPPPDPPATQTPMLAHYQLDEDSGTTASDTSGGGRTATLSGGASFVSGRTGNAVSLSGSSQYVAMPTGVLAGAEQFTFAAWVRLDTVSTWTRVFDFGTGSSVNMFLTARSDTGTPRFAITTGGNGKEQRINGPAALPTGTWTHVAVTLSGDTGILYVNKAEVARTTGMTLTPASLGGSTSRNWIGRSQYSSDPYLDGLVDDVRLYPSALSASAIAALP